MRSMKDSLVSTDCLAGNWPGTAAVPPGLGFIIEASESLGFLVYQHGVGGYFRNKR